MPSVPPRPHTLCLGPRSGICSSYPRRTLTVALLVLRPRPIWCLRLGINSGAGPAFPECQPLCFQLTTGPRPAPYHHPPSNPAASSAQRKAPALVNLVRTGKYFVWRPSSGRKTAASTGRDRGTAGDRRGRAGDRGTHGGPLAGLCRRRLPRGRPSQSHGSLRPRSSVWAVRSDFTALPCGRFPLAFPDFSERKGKMGSCPCWPKDASPCPLTR